jgi:NADH dehydrogenase (ubiquinone) 1 beta subcomplex subunit 7
MSAARLPLPYRDSCAHLLIPLNRCRFEEYYLPWKCEVWLCPLLGKNEAAGC